LILYIELHLERTEHNIKIDIDFTSVYWNTRIVCLLLSEGGDIIEIDIDFYEVVHQYLQVQTELKSKSFLIGHKKKIDFSSLIGIFTNRNRSRFL